MERPPTAPEPPKTALRVRIREEAVRSLAEEALRAEQRAWREVAAVFGTPPAQVGRLRASIRHDVALAPVRTVVVSRYTWWHRLALRCPRLSQATTVAATYQEER